MGLIIISGGQTGVDRAGMDIAHELGIPLMGMVPLGWSTEDDENPESLREDYPELVESSSSSYPYRTRMNVLSADGVMIITRDDVRGHRGTMLTCSIARESNIPLGLVSLRDESSVGRARDWAHGVHGDFRLMIAGPRESGDRGIYHDTMMALRYILTGC